ncbi:PLMP metalloendopeptidase, partial [Polypterus senegalus]
MRKEGAPMTGEKATSAEEARRAALDIVEDALKKNFYGFPIRFVHTCSELVDPYKFCAIPTEQFLRDLLKTLREIRFEENDSPRFRNTFAYVNPDDETRTVYLCKQFWGAPDDLRKDSKPGTLIHEVSHFLGTKDISYKNVYVEVHESYGLLMGKRGAIEEKGEVYTAQEVARVNANSLEYEFETIINHQGRYENGSYTCCGELSRNSVCRHRETGHYHLHERFAKAAP